MSTAPNSFEPEQTVSWPPPRPKFQHNYRRHLIFFGLTFLTTTLTPIGGLLFVEPRALLTWPVIATGLSYSLPILFILTAHEFGHYFACRYYNVDATLPYFIPAPPIFLAGTFGAVIRIREAFPSKRALFDIGVAGPIAGFVALVPLLVWGMTLSTVGPMPAQGYLYYGEPLLWKLLEWWMFGPIPAGMDVALHPIGFAAWWGMLATMLNLLPFGQLDGGHIMYAVFDRHATVASGGVLALLLLLAFLSPSWIVPAVLLTIMSMLFGFRHPRVIDEHLPLDGDRRLVAVMAALIFGLCFMPAPLSFVQP